MARNKANTYEVKEVLPVNAMTVKQYADSKGHTTPYVYELYRKGKLQIVVFKGINFVIT